MPNGMGFPQSTFNEAHGQDLINHMIPYHQAPRVVPVSRHDDERRPACGVRHADSRTDRGAPGQVHLGRRRRLDVIHEKGFTAHTGPAREISTFAKVGIPVTTNFVNGGQSP